jgi:DNA polymerase-3 subunit delta'
MRSQVKQLEDDQKRRAKRSVTDSLDRTLTDLLSFYRDVLIIQLGNAVELVNVELRSELEEFANAPRPK